MGTRDMYKDNVRLALEKCADFLTTYLPLANAHPIQFITDDIWGRLLPTHIQAQLLALSQQELCVLPLNELPMDDLPTSVKCSQRDDGSVDEVSKALGSIDVQADTAHVEFSNKVVGDCLCILKWKHRSLQDFLSAVREHCLETLPAMEDSCIRFREWLQAGGDGATDSTIPFVHAFMKEKKLHEVEIMADVCTHLFHKTSADLVVDVGSGKGYLSTHLSLQSSLPVVAIDSQPGNTSGAQQRADKLAKCWPALVKNEQKKRKTPEQTKGEKKWTANSDIIYSSIPSAPSPQHPPKQKQGDETVKDGPDYVNPFSPTAPSTQLSGGSGGAEWVGRDPSSSVPAQENVQEKNDFVSDSTRHNKQNWVSLDSDTKTVTRQEWASTSDMTTVTSQEGESSNNTLSPKEECTRGITSALPPPRCVPVTMYVSPQTNLSKVVKEAAPNQCQKSSTDMVRLLLTGLHTCGGLGSSMVRLFAQDEAVKAMCGVGCCYQLMQERFVAAADTDTEAGCISEGSCEDSFDFPLSSVLTARKMAVGRTALNVASLALPRMTSSDAPLQGATYYPRALLQAVLKAKLGHIPADLQRLRGLAKKATSPSDYVVKALAKMKIPGCQVTEEEVAKFHSQHCDSEHKMAAFFQLRAALAPVVETVVLLDRLLFLLEQDCVKDAFLIQLFDPVTSPRCHAIVAVKS